MHLRSFGPSFFLPEILEIFLETDFLGPLQKYWYSLK
jgi:hypothetical protein